MKRKNKLLFSLATMSTLIIIVIIYLNAPLHKQTIPTRFIAGENMGFDLGPGNLNFGKIVPGYSASRKINVTNIYNYPTKTIIKSSGEISEYIIVSENNFLLVPNETKEIEFSCFPKRGIELREYPGEIEITTYKV